MPPVNFLALLVLLRSSAACFWSRRGEYALSYSSDDDPSSLVVDVEGQMARFVTKTLRVCSGLVVLTYCT